MAPQLFVELVEEMKGELPVRTICQLFGIAKSTYYRWKKQSFKSGLTDTEELIQKVCVEHRFTYGYRRVTEVIRRTQIINKNTVQKIMQKYGWNCRVKVKKIKRIG
ncbi:IS3 family transposase, partial [Vagococcus lutrae]